MAILRFDRAHGSDQRRWLAGVAVSSCCSRASGALACFAGRGLDVRAEVVGHATADVPRTASAAFAALSGRSPPAAATLAEVRCELAAVEAELLDQLLADLAVSPERVLGVGVNDPGLWSVGPTGAARHFGLCDAALLAEATGMNIVDAFEARDLAQGGLGGPIGAVAQWILLKEPARGRVLLDLGRSTRMSYLPALVSTAAASRILSFDVGPGTDMIDCLARRLTSGKEAFDPGGRLAVQGRRVDALLEHWLSDPYFERPLPRWHPRGVRPERFLGDALQMAVDSGWSIRELLCSATYFVAEAVALALRRRLPEDARVDELIVCGGGQHNGMLLGEISRLIGRPLLRLADVGIDNEAVEPASAAVLAQLHLDQVPANLTAVTGTEVPRVLGRVTPGSPQNWQRWLRAAIETPPAARSLRSAL